MTRRLVLALAACLLMVPRLDATEDAKAVLDGVGKAMGEVNSLQYSGSGAFFSLGQSFTPGEPWPRFGLKSYTRTIDYQTPALRDDVVRAEGDPVARGGGLPIPGGQRLTTAVSGTLAWGQLGEGPVNPAPAAVGDRKRVLSDATHIVELYRIQGTTHADGLIMAYLPKEKLLVEVDVYTPAPPNAAPPAQPNPASVNLYDNIERLKLVVDQILPLHGRKVPLAELQKWIGKAS